MRVAVYTHKREQPDKRTGKPRYLVLACTRYTAEGACIHDIATTSGEDARRKAVKEHRERCLPEPARVCTNGCGHHLEPLWRWCPMCGQYYGTADAQREREAHHTGLSQR